MHPLSGKVVGVTGAGSGIGLATSRLLASHGAILSLADIDEESLEKAEEILSTPGVRFITSLVDICSSDDITAWLYKTETELGPLFGAVNCAGILQVGSATRTIDHVDDEMWTRVIDVNVNGTFKCVREQVKRMSAGASIVNLSSSAGSMGMPGITAYSASKHAIIGLTRSVAKECAGRGIRVNCVAPGVVDTAMVRDKAGKSNEQLMHEVQISTPLGRMASPGEIAESIAFLLSPGSIFMTGAVLAVDGGVTA